VILTLILILMPKLMSILIRQAQRWTAGSAKCPA